jgi:hypothetical protein
VPPGGQGVDLRGGHLQPCPPDGGGVPDPVTGSVGAPCECRRGRHDPAMGAAYGGRMQVAARTEVGHVRARNEDALLVAGRTGWWPSSTAWAGTRPATWPAQPRRPACASPA